MRCQIRFRSVLAFFLINTLFFFMINKFLTSKRLNTSGIEQFEKQVFFTNWIPNEPYFRELLRTNAIGDVVIVSATNFAYRYLTLNLIASLKRNEIDKFLIFCFDSQVYSFLSLKGKFFFNDRLNSINSSSLICISRLSNQYIWSTEGMARQPDQARGRVVGPDSVQTNDSGENEHLVQPSR